MKTYYGGEAVTKGVYLKLSTLELNQLYGESPVLPGGADARYVKLPVALALLGGPLAGLVFIIFLPLIGIVGISSILVYKLERVVMATGHAVFGKRAEVPADSPPDHRNGAE